MAARDSASIKASTSSLLSLRRLEASRADAFHVAPEVPGKWNPAAKLVLIVTSGGLLWAGIFAAIALFF